MLKSLIPFTFNFLLFSSLMSQTHFNGTISLKNSDGNCNPSQGVQVTNLLNPQSTQTTDADGNFSIPASFPARLFFYHPGYEGEVRIINRRGSIPELKVCLEPARNNADNLSGIVSLMDANGNCKPIEGAVVTNLYNPRSYQITDENGKYSFPFSLPLKLFFYYKGLQGKVIEISKPTQDLNICLKEKVKPVVSGVVSLADISQNCIPSSEITITNIYNQNDAAITIDQGKFSITTSFPAKLFFYYPGYRGKFLEVSSPTDNINLCLEPIYCNSIHNLSTIGMNSNENNLVCDSYVEFLEMINKAYLDISKIWHQTGSEKRKKRKEDWKANGKLVKWFGHSKLNNSQIRRVYKRLGKIRKRAFEKIVIIKSTSNCLCCCEILKDKRACVIPAILPTQINICNTTFFHSTSTAERGGVIGHELTHIQLKIKGGNHFGTVGNEKILVEFAKDEPRKARKNPYSYQFLFLDYHY